jgi:hypothetical protein
MGPEAAAERAIPWLYRGGNVDLGALAGNAIVIGSIRRRLALPATLPYIYAEM